jgi:hypothetical protein
MMGVSDVEVVIMIQENPYMQYFCGLEQFATKRLFDDSSLTKISPLQEASHKENRGKIFQRA